LIFAFCDITGSLIAEAVDTTTAAIVRTRNFYGVLKVETDEKTIEGVDYEFRRLMHGTIIHGIQFINEDKRRQPTTYYGHASGIGIAIESNPRRAAADPDNRTLRIGVVGLGTGTIACYGRKGDTVVFYEINPEVLRLSSQYFTYTTDTPARVEVVLGDARIMMERQLAQGHPQEFDVLAVDAFSSDAIPMHLLTRECAALYFKHLKPTDICRSARWSEASA
jgi:hypothetical protein